MHFNMTINRRLVSVLDFSCTLDEVRPNYLLQDLGRYRSEGTFYLKIRIAVVVPEGSFCTENTPPTSTYLINKQNIFILEMCNHVNHTYMQIIPTYKSHLHANHTYMQINKK